jgi:hypothetical protein
MRTGILLECLIGRDYSKDLGIDGRIMNLKICKVGGCGLDSSGSGY